MKSIPGGKCINYNPYTNMITSIPARYPYKMLAQAIIDNDVSDDMVPHMWRMRHQRHRNDLRERLDVESIKIVLDYIKEKFPIEDYPEKYI